MLPCGPGSSLHPEPAKPDAEAVPALGHDPAVHPNHTARSAGQSQPPLLLLAGPTAVGKSAVALHLAEALGGEIVSVDSMQVYRGLDIGTAKPGPAERARVAHHLIDVVELTEPFDAARFAALAHQAVQEILARGRLPILCGGTGLYFQAFLEGVGEGPPPDPALRAELERLPLHQLWEELARRDPEAWQWIDRQNRRRLVRALEVIRLTGKPFSAQRPPWGKQVVASHPVVHVFVGLYRRPEDLRARIEARVEEMFRRGLVQETAALLARGLEQNRTAMQALGYRQVVEHLRGVRSLPETIQLVKLRTWQLARRQMTWFRKYGVRTWIQADPDEPVHSLAERVVQVWRQATPGQAAGS